MSGQMVALFVCALGVGIGAAVSVLMDRYEQIRNQAADRKRIQESDAERPSAVHADIEEGTERIDTDRDARDPHHEQPKPAVSDGDRVDAIGVLLDDAARPYGPAVDRVEGNREQQYRVDLGHCSEGSAGDDEVFHPRTLSGRVPTGESPDGGIR